MAMATPRQRRDLKQAEYLLVMGLHPSEIIKGYELACTKVLANLQSGSPFLNGAGGERD